MEPTSQHQVRLWVPTSPPPSTPVSAENPQVRTIVLLKVPVHAVLFASACCPDFHSNQQYPKNSLVISSGLGGTSLIAMRRVPLNTRGEVIGGFCIAARDSHGTGCRTGGSGT